ncbi:MAG TPA: radical SAM family heme chaperone HemW, partial [Bacteroidia bacterium]|nr:radical SAM family heme chaperone HemW [Bacteroidia bacterium]
ELKTIYFGGGTPSILSRDELETIFTEISRHFNIAANAEITLEANPDDLSTEFLRELKKTPVNRLSIGIQSFRDEDLRLMNRIHSAAEAKSAVKKAQDAGFTNITIDLIYGIPGLTMEDWQKNLEEFRQLNVPHLSAYCLTVEPRTALAHQVKKGIAKPVNEEEAAAHFLELARFTAEMGFEHYEISNFAKTGFIAQHNSSYWFGEPYLGIGPSAHSLQNNTRRWNVSSNTKYIQLIGSGAPAWTEEILKPQEQFNEYVLTRLRTKWGIDTGKIAMKFPFVNRQELQDKLEPWIRSGHVIQDAELYFLSTSGKLFTDRIAASLFVV